MINPEFCGMSSLPVFSSLVLRCKSKSSALIWLSCLASCGVSWIFNAVDVNTESSKWSFIFTDRRLTVEYLFIELYPFCKAEARFLKMFKTFLPFQVGKSHLRSLVLNSRRNGLKETRTFLRQVRGLHSSSSQFNKNKAVPAGVIEEGDEEFIIR